MWSHAIQVAVICFAVVFAGLIMLTIGVKVMSFFCALVEKMNRRS